MFELPDDKILSPTKEQLKEGFGILEEALEITDKAVK